MLFIEDLVEDRGRFCLQYKVDGFDNSEIGLLFGDNFGDIFEHVHKKTCSGLALTELNSHRRWPETWNFRFKK